MWNLSAESIWTVNVIPSHILLLEKVV